MYALQLRWLSYLSLELKQCELCLPIRIHSFLLCQETTGLVSLHAHIHMSNVLNMHAFNIKVLPQFSCHLKLLSLTPGEICLKSVRLL